MNFRQKIPYDKAKGRKEILKPKIHPIYPQIMAGCQLTTWQR